MGFDENKNASRISIEVRFSKSNPYSGVDLLKIADELAKSPTLDESSLAANAGVKPGHNNSGVGDLKRLIISIWNRNPKDCRI